MWDIRINKISYSRLGYLNNLSSSRVMPGIYQAKSCNADKTDALIFLNLEGIDTPPEMEKIGINEGKYLRNE